VLLDLEMESRADEHDYVRCEQLVVMGGRNLEGWTRPRNLSPDNDNGRTQLRVAGLSPSEPGSFCLRNYLEMRSWPGCNCSQPRRLWRGMIMLLDWCTSFWPDRPQCVTIVASRFINCRVAKIGYVAPAVSVR
jgi:hypothetical protein